MASSLSTFTTKSGFLLPSIHSAPPFFTQQPNPTTQSLINDQWIRLICSYARHRRLFFLKAEDAELKDGDNVEGAEWADVLRNERINRRISAKYLESMISTLVAKNLAVYDPPKQTRRVLVLWRSVDEWAGSLAEWAFSTAQLNTILTYYDITEPVVPSELTGIPESLLKKAIQVLVKQGRAQTLSVSDGEGVRIFR